MSLIVIVFVISIVFSRNSQAQTMPSPIVTSYYVDNSAVEHQRAYNVPAIAENYTGNSGGQQLANNKAVAPLFSSSTQPESSNAGSKVQPSATIQSSSANTSQMIMSSMATSLNSQSDN